MSQASIQRCLVKAGQPPDSLATVGGTHWKENWQGALGPLLLGSELALGSLCLQVGPGYTWERRNQRKSLRWGIGG